MGCMQSLPEGKSSPVESAVFVFVPGFRSPCRTSDLSHALNITLVKSPSFVEHLNALRNRIEVMALGEGNEPKLYRKKATSQEQSTQLPHSSKLHCASTVADLQLAVEDYVPVLLALVEEDRLRNTLEFCWTNQEDYQQITTISDIRYELLSMLHLLAMLRLSQANILLTPKPPSDGYQPKVAEENKRASLDSLLKASGILKFALTYMTTQMPEELMRQLPCDLNKATMHALCMQALAQGIEIQLSFAVENVKATLAVKRRLACEQLKCWTQVKENISIVHAASTWGQKHRLFVEWKLAEAKATAYYFHALILDESPEEEKRKTAARCLILAESFLLESKRYCAEFCAATPTSRVPPLLGVMKFLSEKIPKDAHIKRQSGRAGPEKDSKVLPDLPDFVIALQPEEYELPSVDVAWRAELSKSVGKQW